MKQLLTILLILFCGNLFAQTIPVTGWNQDVLVDPVLNSTASSTRSIDMDRGGYSFYMDGYSPNGTKLPNGLTSTFTSTTGTTYQLQSYNQNNALWLGTEEIGTLTLTTPAQYSTIKIATTAQSARLYYTVTYTDGSSDAGMVIIPNWYCNGCSNYAINNLGRVDGSGTLDGTSWAIYEGIMHPNPAKFVKYITFKSASSWLAIFAISSATGGTYTPSATDNTVYLEQGNSATITSPISGSTYSWREISSDFNSNATINSTSSRTTSVTGLPQGVFYFEATVDGNKKDTAVIRVANNLPPKFSALWHDFDMTSMGIDTAINYRGDTVNYIPQSSPYMQFGDSDQSYTSANWWSLYRDRMNGMNIDSAKGKIYTRIEDGYGHGSISNGDTLKYARSEIEFYSLQDTNTVNMYEWKGYFPKPPDSNYLKNNNGLILAIFQVHGAEYDYAIANFELRADGLYFRNEITGTQAQTTDVYQKESAFICSWDELYNKSHTLRVTMREGLGGANQKAFIKVDFDGVTKYYRNKGGVGSAYFDDYSKIGSLYDWSKAIVNPDSLARGRKFAIANESLRKYVLLETAPLVKTDAKKYALLSTGSVTLTGTVVAGSSSISSYLWTKISGGSATITSPNALSTTVTGLTQGTYIFNLAVTDANGLTTNSTTQVIVDVNKNIAATGYNYDVISDAVLNSTASSLRNNDVDGFGYSFYADGYSPNATALLDGLPASGTIISPANTVYQFQSYNQNNALRLNSGVAGTLTLTTPSKFNKIKIAITSGGGGTATYQINYSDGTNDIISHTIGNWACQSCTPFAINDLGRVDGSGTLDNNVWAIYEDSIAPNPNKTVNSITFSANSTLSVFALTDATITAPSISVSGDQPNVTLDHTSVSAVGTPASGQTITGYSWSKVSGAAVTFGTPNSASTTVAGLTTGTYVLRCTVTQSDGQTAYGDVTITVNIPPVPVTTSKLNLKLPTKFNNK